MSRKYDCMVLCRSDFSFAFICTKKYTNAIWNNMIIFIITIKCDNTCYPNWWTELHSVQNKNYKWCWCHIACHRMILVFGTSGPGIELSFFSGEATVIYEKTARTRSLWTVKHLYAKSALGVFMSRYVKCWGSVFGVRWRFEIHFCRGYFQYIFIH